MLERMTHAGGVVYYRSSLLAERGITHAFSTRLGGISPAPFDSLNLGNPSEGTTLDDVGNIQRNYARLQEALGISQFPRVWVKQVHSRKVELVEAEGEGEYAETVGALIEDHFHGQREADALVTELPGVLLTVRVADCAPVLLAATDGKVVAAVHAGWRGMVNGVLPRTLLAMGELGVPVGNMVAAIGPCISQKHFEVGPEVANFFDIAHLSLAVERSRFAKPHVDLCRALRQQLTSAGVNEVDWRDDESFCSFENAREFFSHRRDQGVAGRMAAVIARSGARSGSTV